MLGLLGFFSETTLVEGECYERQIVCYGYISGSCAGFELENLEVEPSDSCEHSDRIVERCEQFGESFCEEGESDWMDSSEVDGLKCSKWNEEYEIEDLC